MTHSEADQREKLHQQALALPTRPGVYIFQDQQGEALYVGKAKNLKSRVVSYFHQSRRHHPKTRQLIKKAAQLDTLVADSETEALLLEANLIQTHQPPFNVRLRSDAGYPYVRVSIQEPFPRIEIAHQIQEDKARYFGPFPRVGALSRVVRELMRVYQIRSCSWDLPDSAPDRPCLDYHIDRCQAPCVGKQSRKDYQDNIQQAMKVLRGQTSEFSDQLEEEMETQARELNFERAEQLKQTIESLQTFTPRPQVSDPRGGNRDVLGVATCAGQGCVVLFQIRDGELRGRKYRFLERPENSPPEELVEQYIQGSYLQTSHPPGELLLPFSVPNQDLLREYIAARRQKAFEIRVPQRGHDRRLVELARRNGQHLLDQEGRPQPPDRLVEGGEPEFEAGRALARALDLPDSPRDLVGFDISTLQGVDSVGSAVWLREGEPLKEEYRHFRIRQQQDSKPDDYRMMEEVVGRFFEQRKDRKLSCPDLIVIDGGRGQLGAAQKALQQLELEPPPLVALAKQQEEVFQPDRDQPLQLSKNNPGLHWLQRVRDEAHRFALKYHHTLRERRTLRSQLDDVPGIGGRRAQKLLQAFGSVEGVRQASREELEKVEGVGPALARQLQDVLVESQH